MPSALETWLAATSLVRGPSSSSNSDSSRLPASSIGAHFRTAPVFCEISCQGTILAWCSRCVMTISSPGCRCLPPQACGHQVDRLGGAAHEDDVFGRWGADELGHRVAGVLVGVGGPGRQFVGGSVNVGVLVGVEMRQPVDDHLRLLGGRRVVEPDQRLSVDGLLQDREVGPHGVDVEHLVFVRQLWHRVGCGQEVVVVVVAGRRIRRDCAARGRIGPDQVDNRRRLGQPVRRRATGSHRNRRHRSGQHTGHCRDDALGRHREGSQVTGGQVGIGDAASGFGGRRCSCGVGHVAAGGDRHRLRWGFGFGRRRSREVDIPGTYQRNRRGVQIRSARRGLSGRSGRCRVRHVAARRDRRRLRRTIESRTDAGGIQLVGQRGEFRSADRQVAFGV